MSDAIRAAQVRAAENLVVQDLIAMGLVAAPQDKAHPTPSDYCRMDDGRCGICGGDWSVCGCQGMLDRRSLAAPVASNTTAEPAPIQPAGVEVERDAARYRWLRDTPEAQWRPFALRLGITPQQADKLVTDAMVADIAQGRSK